MDVEDYFKNGKIKVWKEKFAVIKSKHPIADSFAVINDKNEITVVIDQSKIEENSNNIINIEKDWKILTFDMILPFGLVGFLAKISKILADENLSIFVISSYSTDHILIKEKNLNRALEKLSELGFIVNR
ncbi:MAG: ACT domain-containing protein [Nanoarchaeota archaeon]